MIPIVFHFPAIYVWLLPIVAVSGWCLGYKRTKHEKDKTRSLLNRKYLQGLNFLLNEEPDKAVDVFLKMLEVDSDTVETHLALANLFRRKGEVDRAIRIHQNLIARPHLDKHHRLQSLLELGRDYLSAGVFDRAERLFLEVSGAGQYTAESLRALLDIYELEKDWQQAIATAQKLAVNTGKPYHRAIAHYYCELAELAHSCRDEDKAGQYVKRALSLDRACVRASLLLGELETNSKRFPVAIKAYKRVANQDPAFLALVIMPLVHCYEMTGEEQEKDEFLLSCLRDSPASLLTFLQQPKLRVWLAAHVKSESFTSYLRHHSSVMAMYCALQLQFDDNAALENQTLQLVSDIAESLLSRQASYRCEHCGFSGKAIHWHCPGCKQWSTIKPLQFDLETE